jgi:hypothetical protein
MLDAAFKHKTTLIFKVRSTCAEGKVQVQVIPGRRLTDRFILLLKGERENVAKVHLRLLEELSTEDVELVAVRDRRASFVMSFVVMEKAEAQHPHTTGRRAKLQSESG